MTSLVWSRNRTNFCHRETRFKNKWFSPLWYRWLLRQGIFKSDYISRYLHTWVESTHVVILVQVYNIINIWLSIAVLLFWSWSKVSLIAIELLLQDEQCKFCRFFFVRSSHNRQCALRLHWLLEIVNINCDKWHKGIMF